MARKSSVGRGLSVGKKRIAQRTKVNSQNREVVTKERYQDVSYACEKFVESMRKQCRAIVGIKKIDCDFAVLYDVVKSTYDDIWRYKDYHFVNPDDQRLNGIKRAAYITKWLIRMRPIFVDREPSNFSSDDGTILLNETFAIYLAFEYIAQELGVTGLKLNTPKTNELIYDLHYRDLSDDALLAYYQAIADFVADPTIVEVSLNS